MIWFVWVLSHINHSRLLMPNPFSYIYIYTVLFQTIQFLISIVFVYTQFIIKTVLFQTIQFSMQKQFYFTQFSLALVCLLMSKQSCFKQFSLAQVHNFVRFDP